MHNVEEGVMKNFEQLYLLTSNALGSDGKPIIYGKSGC